MFVQSLNIKWMQCLEARRPAHCDGPRAASGRRLGAASAAYCCVQPRHSVYNSPKGGSPGEAARRSPDAAAAAAAAAADPRDMMAAIEKSVARGLHPDMASSRPPASITDEAKI